MQIINSSRLGENGHDILCFFPLSALSTLLLPLNLGLAIGLSLSNETLANVTTTGFKSTFPLRLPFPVVLWNPETTMRRSLE